MNNGSFSLPSSIDGSRPSSSWLLSPLRVSYSALVRSHLCLVIDSHRKSEEPIKQHRGRCDDH